MNFETFQKSMSFLEKWRTKHDRDANEYPDSRDPEFRDEMLDAGIVSQDLEKSLVALAAWREGKDDVYRGVSAFAHLIRNRTNKGMFRSHLTDEYQFPSMVDPEDDRISEYPSEEDTIERLLGNLDDILEGRVVDITQGSLWCGVLGEQEWFDDLITDPERTRTVLIGTRTFLK